MCSQIKFAPHRDVEVAVTAAFPKQLIPGRGTITLCRVDLPRYRVLLQILRPRVLLLSSSDNSLDGSQKFNETAGCIMLFIFTGVLCFVHCVPYYQCGCYCVSSHKMAGFQLGGQYFVMCGGFCICWREKVLTMNSYIELCTKPKIFLWNLSLLMCFECESMMAFSGGTSLLHRMCLMQDPWSHLSRDS